MARPTPDDIDQLAIDLAVAKQMLEHLGHLGHHIPDVLQRVIQWAVNQDVEGPVESPLPPIDPHRAAHRVGSPSHIDTDPGLTALIRARIDRLTFKDIAADIAAHVPPERRASLSGLHRWFHRQKRHGAGR